MDAEVVGQSNGVRISVVLALNCRRHLRKCAWCKASVRVDQESRIIHRPFLQCHDWACIGQFTCFASRNNSFSLRTLHGGPITHRRQTTLTKWRKCVPSARKHENTWKLPKKPVNHRLVGLSSRKSPTARVALHYYRSPASTAFKRHYF